MTPVRLEAKVLRARLLGALEVELNGTAIDSPGSQRPWAVFAYLALAPGAVSRAELTSTFWPDVLDQSAACAAHCGRSVARSATAYWSTANASVSITTGGSG